MAKTFDTDFCTFVFEGKNINVTCIELGLKWPPPEKLEFLGFSFYQARRSQITDAQKEGCDFVARGAEYKIDG